MEMISQLSPGDQDRIHAAATKKRVDNAASAGEEPGSKRRKFSHVTEEQVLPSSYPSDTTSLFDTADFMKPQTQEVIHKCIAKFIDPTGNAALACATCVVCAREVVQTDAEVKFIDAIPNQYLLHPSKPHAAHQLTNGMLLHPSAIITSTRGQQGYVCKECMTKLKKGHLPKLALANSMWIGDIPFELSVLTLPERVLIAQHFPAVHIVKLFPQTKGARSTNCALRGNVLTYRLDTDKIASMVEGNIMPNPSQVIASTIRVTIIGPKNIRERTMPGFLWVRRSRICAALVWLKANNPLYAEIIISDERLEMLTENGVPEEISAAMRHSGNIEELEREREGYVPEDDEFRTSSGTGGTCQLFTFLLLVKYSQITNQGLVDIDEDIDLEQQQETDGQFE
jgi:hypothetical protein